MAEGLTLKIESCYDCPRLKTRQTSHFLIYPKTGYIYTCTKANRVISPSDGVEPPPDFCPIRS